MDSLLANYASSDDEDNIVEEEEKKASAPPPKPSLFASSLPPPKAASARSSSSLFSSLPAPKSLSGVPLSTPAPKSRGLGGEDGENNERGSKPNDKNPPSSAPLSKPPSSSIFSSLPAPQTSASPFLFSSLPPPKSSQQSNPPQPSNPASLDQNPKKVVHFTLPLNPSVLQSGDFDEDDDEEEEKEKKRCKHSSSAASKALSSMLPAPKNSLCLAPAAASAASRRSVVEADVPAANLEGIGQQQEMSGFESYGGYYDGGWVGGSAEAGAEGTAVNSGFTSTNGASGWNPNYGGAVGYGSGVAVNYESGGGMDHRSGGMVDYGSYGGNWSDGSAAMSAPEVAGIGRTGGKRGRNEIPIEVVEVKQDELMKNRPREDKAKLTGIAFGPSYQFLQSRESPQNFTKESIRLGLCTMT